MGVDIHCSVELNSKGAWKLLDDSELFSIQGSKYKTFGPFMHRLYSVFGFLADIRNYSKCTPIIPERRGIPEDCDNDIKSYLEQYDYFCTSHLYLNELLDFDYDKTFWDRRISKGNDGAALAEEGEGRIITYREHLGDLYFVNLNELSELSKLTDVSNIRIVFGFN